MRWMETIRMQSSTGMEQIAEGELTALACDIQSDPDCQGFQEMTVWKHAAVPGFFALRLFWDNDNPRPGGSLVGMSLARSLKAFGLVDHSVWIETGNKKIKERGKNNVQSNK